MTRYKIKPYSFKQAKKLGVEIEPSDNPKYKIDVYKGDDYITSIGAIGYSDFPTFTQDEGIEYAKKRRDLYHIRHKKDMSKVGSRGYYAGKILW